MSGHTLLLSDSGTTSIPDTSVQSTLYDRSVGSAAEGSSRSQQCNSQLTIFLHGGHAEDLPKEDLSRSVEEVTKRLLLKYYPGIGPAAINLFGLAMLDTKKADTFVWKSPRRLMKDLLSRLKNNSNLKLLLRVRFLPARNRVQNLKMLGDDMVQYLYHQLREDLLTERMKSIFGSRTKLTSAKCRGLAVLDILINSRFQKKDIETFLELCKLKDFLPPSESVTFLKRMKLEKNMKDQLKSFSQSHADTDLSELMIGYIRDILKEVLDYSVEKFDASTWNMTDNKRCLTKILVDIHHQPSGVFIGGMPFSRVEDLFSASICPNYLDNSNTWSVHLDRTQGRPEVLAFVSEEIAESFVSCLVGYYRFIHDYYFSLCRDMEPLSLQSLKRIKSHGPIEKTCAERKLEEKSKSEIQENFYLCRQDVNQFDEFLIVYMTNGSVTTVRVQQVGGAFYLLPDKQRAADNPGRLVQDLLNTEHHDVSATNVMCLKPGRDETCGILKGLFMDENPAILDEDSKQKAETTLSKQPIVIPESAITVKNIIGLGQFTEVLEGMYREGNNTRTVAIKRLRTKTTLNQLYSCFEPFHYAVRRHNAFRDVQDPVFFAGVVGICLTTPLRFIMDYAIEGSLSHFFTHRQTDQPIYLRHLVYAATQVAQGLFQLEEENLQMDKMNHKDRNSDDESRLYHGNICCRNILVYRYDISEIVVKLADPGLLQVYNSVPLTDKVNRKRIPWIAPELFFDRQRCGSIRSDMYSMGTTIWEMFAQGVNPMDMDPLSMMSIENQMVFFRSDDNSLPETPGLITNKKDSNHMSICKERMRDIMQRCRMPSPEDRPTAKELVRDLLTLTSSYAGEYHDYDQIPCDEYPMYLQDTPKTSAEHDSDDDVPDISGNILMVEEILVEPHSMPCVPTVVERVAVPILKVDLPRKVPKPSSRIGPPPRRPLPQEPVAVSTRDTEMDFKHIIHSQRLKIFDTVIGQGHYGEVKKGYLYPIISDRQRHSMASRTVIAAKCLKGRDVTPVLQSKDFKKEAEIMANLRHDNIVHFYGTCENMIIMEYVDNGAMSVYLRVLWKKKQPLSVPRLMSMMQDVAAGMKYLAERNIIHSDLAGRNILLTKDLRAKISDFGLARSLGPERDYYRRSKDRELPASWCAPEGLDKLKFTTNSDVWSYGVVLWEAITHGKRPKYGSDSRKILQYLNEGVMLDRPNNCPDEVWDLMKWCWKFEPGQRPTFEEIHQECSKTLEKLPTPTEVTQADRTASPSTNANVASVTGGAPSLNIPSIGILNTIIVNGVTADMPVKIFREPRGSLVTDKPSASDTVVSNVTYVSPGINQCTPSHVEPPVNGVSPGINQFTPSPVEPPVNGVSPGINQFTPSPVEPPVNGVSPGINQFPPSPVESSMNGASPGTKTKRDLPRTPSQDLKFLISTQDLRIDEGHLLGTGEFGCVYKGTYKQNDVAVKVIHDRHLGNEASKLFLEEVDVFGKASHINIVSFLGYVREGKFGDRDTKLLVMEYVTKGSLLRYLSLCKEGKESLSLQQMLRVMNDISAGMNYLVGEKIIHCDLAARNVLLMDNMTAKISDFGLSKALGADSDYYHRKSDKKKLPGFWCAPEVLNYKKLSHQSDVWSFGITVWEIFTYGDSPNICGVEGKDVVDLTRIGLDHMKKGFRLHRPERCPEDVYDLMHQCWEWDADDRPTFSTIYKQCLSLSDKYGQTIQ